MFMGPMFISFICQNDKLLQETPITLFNKIPFWKLLGNVVDHLSKLDILYFVCIMIYCGLIGIHFNYY